MPLKNPDNWDKLTDLTFLYQNAFALFIATLAAIAAHIEKIRNKTLKGFHIIVFFYDLLISAFVGLLTLYSCLYFKLPMEATGVLVGVFSHQGTRALALLTNIVFAKVEAKFNIKDKN